jgi:hypothetical protein
VAAQAVRSSPKPSSPAAPLEAREQRGDRARSHQMIEQHQQRLIERFMRIALGQQPQMGGRWC